MLGETYGRFIITRMCGTQIGLVSSSVHQMMEDDRTGSESGRQRALCADWILGRMRAADRRAAVAVLRRIEACGIARRPWRYLSQGERQRVLIGRALMASPGCSSSTSRAPDSTRSRGRTSCKFLSVSLGPHTPTMVLVTHHVEEIVPFSPTCWCSNQAA